MFLELFIVIDNIAIYEPNSQLKQYTLYMCLPTKHRAYPSSASSRMYLCIHYLDNWCYLTTIWTTKQCVHVCMCLIVCVCVFMCVCVCACVCLCVHVKDKTNWINLMSFSWYIQCFTWTWTAAHKTVWETKPVQNAICRCDGWTHVREIFAYPTIPVAHAMNTTHTAENSVIKKKCLDLQQFL